MQVQVGVGAGVYGRDEPVGELLARGAVGAAGEHAVQVPAVLRHDVDAARPEAAAVEDGKHQQRAPESGGIDSQQAQRRLDRAVFRAVHAGRDEQHRAGLGSLQQAERQLQALDGMAEPLLATHAPGAELRQADHAKPLPRGARAHRTGRYRGWARAVNEARCRGPVSIPVFDPPRCIEPPTCGQTGRKAHRARCNPAADATRPRMASRPGRCRSCPVPTSTCSRPSTCCLLRAAWRGCQDPRPERLDHEPDPAAHARRDRRPAAGPPPGRRALVRRGFRPSRLGSPRFDPLVRIISRHDCGRAATST